MPDEPITDKVEKISISLPSSLLERIDQEVKKTGKKRSTVIATLLESRLSHLEKFNSSDGTAIGTMADTFCGPALADRLRSLLRKQEVDQRLLVERLLASLADAIEDYGKHVTNESFKLMPMSDYVALIDDIRGIHEAATDCLKQIRDQGECETIDELIECFWMTADMNLPEFYPYQIYEEIELYQKHHARRADLQAKSKVKNQPKS